MKSYSKNIEVRWADIDPNNHVMQSKYFEYGAYVRTAFLVEHGMDFTYMHLHHITAVMFAESCTFLKEITFGNAVKTDFFLAALSNDYRKWRITQHIYVENKKEEGWKTAGIIKGEGAWMNTTTRKVSKPTPELKSLFDAAPKTEDFYFFD